MLADLLASGPRAVTLMLTTRCNLQCAYCDQARSQPRTMGADVLRAGLKQLLGSNHSHPTLTFFGGEPLLEAKMLQEAVSFAREHRPAWMRPDLRLFTNGLLIDSEIICFFSDANVHVWLSMDGLPGAQNQRAPGSFEALDELLRVLARDHAEYFERRFSVAITLTSRNVTFLAGSFRYLACRGVRDIRVTPVTHDPKWSAESSRELDRQLLDVALASQDILACTGEIPFLPFRSPDRATGHRPRSHHLCGAGNRRALFVDVDGRIAPCAALASSTLARPAPRLQEALAALGPVDVRDPDLDAKLAEREWTIRSVVGREIAGWPGMSRCRECPASASCFVCPAATALAGGRVPDFHCDVNWLLAKHRARLGRAASDTALSPR